MVVRMTKGRPCEIAKELDLKSPFESDAPVHLHYSKDLKPVASRACGRTANRNTVLSTAPAR